MKTVSTQGVLPFTLSVGVLLSLPLFFSLISTGELSLAIGSMVATIAVISLLFPGPLLNRLERKLKDYPSLPSFNNRYELDTFLTLKNMFAQTSKKFVWSVRSLLSLSLAITLVSQTYSIFFSQISLVSVAVLSTASVIYYLLAAWALDRLFVSKVNHLLYPVEEGEIIGAMYFQEEEERAIYIGLIGSHKEELRLSKIIADRYPQLVSPDGHPMWGVFHVSRSALRL